MIRRIFFLHSVAGHCEAVSTHGDTVAVTLHTHTAASARLLLVIGVGIRLCVSPLVYIRVGTVPDCCKHTVGPISEKTVKVKSVPLQAWTGPEGSRNLRFPDFVTTAQDCGNVVSLTHRPSLPPRNAPGTHFC